MSLPFRHHIQRVAAGHAQPRAFSSLIISIRHHRPAPHRAPTARPASFPIQPIPRRGAMSTSHPATSTPSAPGTSPLQGEEEAPPAVAPGGELPQEEQGSSPGRQEPQPQLRQSSSEQQQRQETPSSTLLLEDGSASPSSSTIQLDVSGGEASAQLDHLGPLVVHEDGTLSRIANWTEMTDIERKNTLRVLGKRNQLRLSKLRGESSDDGTAGGSGAKVK